MYGYAVVLVDFRKLPHIPKDMKKKKKVIVIVKEL